MEHSQFWPKYWQKICLHLCFLLQNIEKQAKHVNLIIFVNFHNCRQYPCRNWRPYSPQKYRNYHKKYRKRKWWVNFLLLRTGQSWFYIDWLILSDWSGLGLETTIRTVKGVNLVLPELRYGLPIYKWWCKVIKFITFNFLGGKHHFWRSGHQFIRSFVHTPSKG